MITKKTVFVLGAGASADFGYPIGRALLDAVYEGLAPGGNARLVLNDTTRFNGTQMNTFRDALWHSGQSSVDAFLEHRPNFVDIGKAAMAAVLVPKEIHDQLWKPQNNWLLYLFGMMGTTFDQFKNHKLSFVTYNYDRTLEHFLMTSLCNTYGRSVEECKKVQPEIIHLHGRLDYLPWELDKGGRAYGDMHLTGPRMASLIRDIKIVHEDPADGRDEDFKRASELLSAAEQIYFLGFGYGQVNLKRLTVDFNHRSRGTAFGLTGHEINSIRKRTGDAIGLETLNCMDFMRQVVSLFD